MSADASLVTTIPGISSALNSLFDQMRSGGDKLLRTSSKNAMILFTEDGLYSEAQNLVGILTEVSPARIFLLHPDEQSVSPQASVSALCHGLSKLEHICSEIVTIKFSRQDAHRIPFIVRANNISGVNSELYVLGKVQGWESELRGLIHISDSIIFDSGCYPDQFGFMLGEGGTEKRMIDLAWLRLSSWRDELRSIFESAEFSSSIERTISALSEIRVFAEYSGNPTSALQPF